jgi:broad specificity polyphosphatase/5'/3'-nucleotidase SurE
MRVLLTNDDGVGAPGNVVLAQALLDEGHEVQVIGPLG